MSADIDVHGAAQLHRRLNAISTKYVAKQLLRQWQMETVAGAKRRVPRQTSNLSRSIHAVPGVSTLKASVEASANYAAYVEFDTKAHIIRPRYAKVLAWGGSRRLSGALRSGSKPTHFARLVHHPGTKAQPFLMPAGEEALDNLGIATIITLWNGAA